MADIKTAEERSINMAAIRSKDTSPELFLRHLLFSHGYRYRIHATSVPGHPDLWMKKYNTAIFVHGCFWHRHGNCKYAYMPKSRTDFWMDKFDRNISRDNVVRKELAEKSIKCLTIWECTIKKAQKKSSCLDILLDEIEMFLNSRDLYKEM